MKHRHRFSVLLLLILAAGCLVVQTTPLDGKRQTKFTLQHERTSNAPARVGEPFSDEDDLALVTLPDASSPTVFTLVHDMRVLLQPDTHSIDRIRDKSPPACLLSRIFERIRMRCCDFIITR